MKRTFLDKHGREIKASMTIQHDNGETEKVYAVTDAYGDESLGVMATNPEYLKHHPEHDIEYYDLSNFNTTSEWEIIKEVSKNV